MPDGSKISGVNRSKETARESYNKLSRFYDLLAGFSEKKLRQKALEKLNVRRGETVLEAGFGTGATLVSLARATGPAGKVYGIDISDNMCDLALAKAEKLRLSERIHIVRGDAAALPFPADSFTALFYSFTLELFDTPEIPVVLGEARRVLRPRGRIGVVGMSKKGGNRLMLSLYERAHERFPSFIDCRPILVRRALEKAGFTVTSSEVATTWGLPVEITIGKKEC